MKTYYIVEISTKYTKYWEAYTGILARLGFFSMIECVAGTVSYESADDCEKLLGKAVDKTTYRVIGVVKL